MDGHPFIIVWFSIYVTLTKYLDGRSTVLGLPEGKLPMEFSGAERCLGKGTFPSNNRTGYDENGKVTLVRSIHKIMFKTGKLNWKISILQLRMQCKYWHLS